MSGRPMRIALLTHSTNRRGGVVHVTQLGEALAELGHSVIVHAPDPGGKGMGRALTCGFVSVPARPVSGSLTDLVRQRISEYIAYFDHSVGERFDLYHAHDGIGGCALAALAASGKIRGFIRTVHHIDEFAEPYLSEQQNRSIEAATQVLCVSRVWKEQLERRYGIRAEQISNGVDLKRFTPTADKGDETVRTRYELRKGTPVFLSIGGVEPRKNTARLLEAFVQLHDRQPAAQLLIVGGATLLDHSAYRHSFEAILRKSGWTVGSDVLMTGPVPDEHLPALMRIATALVFPSIIEGFGLVVLEAMASGTPVVVSRIEPFTEYLDESDCVWVDPLDVGSILGGMTRVSDPAVSAAVSIRGLQVAARYPWERTARMHQSIYERFLADDMRSRASNTGNSA